MADDSSRRALENAFSLICGLELPAKIYSQHNFASRLTAADRELPKVHLIVKNRLTQYMGSASAYAAVLESIDIRLQRLLRDQPSLFTFEHLDAGIVEMRDFQTTGVVAFARGLSFADIKSGRHTIGDQDVQVKASYKENCLKALNELVDRVEVT